ncbi:MAG: prenyltransferase [Candidatus Saccharimonadales bacterium]
MATNTLSSKDILLSSRPFWWITTATPFVIGYLTHAVHFSWALVIGAIYFLFPYNLFLYGINDIFDYESDIRNPRKAGIEGAVLVKEKHWPLFLVILATNVPYWIYFLRIGNRLASLWLVVMVVMALAYSVKRVRFKEIPLVDSLTSAFHYTSPFLFGVLLITGQFDWLRGFIAFFIWSIANHAFGAIQDIKPDTEAGIRSIATALGANRTVWFCLGVYCVAALLPTLFFGAAGIVVSGILLSYVWLVAHTLPYRTQPSHPVFHRSWQLLTYLNYGNGLLLSLYFIGLYKFVR